MTPQREGWNLNLVGAWNPAIINPAWLAANVLDSDEIQVEVAIVETAGLQTSLTFNQVKIKPSKTRLIILPLNYNDTTLDFCDKIAKDIFELLPHTPIGAVGTNFTFTETNPTENSVLSLFDNNDEIDLSNHNYLPSSKTLSRTLICESDNRQLNLKFNLNNINTPEMRINIEFNYHHARKNYTKLSEMISGFKDLRDKSLEILSKVYNIECEDI